MAIYTFQLKVNGVDVATYGFSVASFNTWDGPGISFDEVAIPGQDGTTATTVEPLLAPLDFVVVGELIGTSPSDFETKLDTFKQALSIATLTLISGNISTRQRTGVYVGPMTVTPYPTMDAAVLKFTVHCRNPLGYATTQTTLTAAVSVTTTCALGTYRSRPIITLAGASNPSLTYANASGTAVSTLTVTATGTITVDCSADTITVNGSRSDVSLSLGDFFRLDPRDGNYGSNSWPSVTTSSGSLSMTYTKAYW